MGYSDQEIKNFLPEEKEEKAEYEEFKCNSIAGVCEEYFNLLELYSNMEFEYGEYIKIKQENKKNVANNN